MCKTQARVRLEEAEKLTRLALSDVQIAEKPRRIVAEAVRHAIRSLETARAMIEKGCL
jgi:hypothetical protein